MKRAILTIVLLSTPFLFCYTIGQRQDVGPFHSINIGSEIDAELILEQKEGVEFSLNNIEPDKIITEVRDNILKIRLKPGLHKDAEVKVKIYFTSIDEVESSGKANIWSEEDLYVNKVKFTLNNGGQIRLSLLADSVYASLGEGSMLYLKGNTGLLDVKVGTGATYSGYDFECDEVYVLSNSGGKAKIAVNKYLRAEAVSKGFIGYIGDPEKVEEKTSLGGEITKTYKE